MKVFFIFFSVCKKFYKNYLYINYYFHFPNFWPSKIERSIVLIKYSPFIVLQIFCRKRNIKRRKTKGFIRKTTLWWIGRACSSILEWEKASRWWKVGTKSQGSSSSHQNSGVRPSAGATRRDYIPRDWR